ncbi:MAG: class I SAM-dependent RNA methyltransferase [Actinomycetota bacterium]
MATSSSGGRHGRYRAAAVCTPGLEAVCAAELTELGMRPKSAGPGLLTFEANRRQLYAANVWLRTAARVTVRVATFRATDFAHLQDHAATIDWDRWVPPGFAPRFRITSTDSKLYHTKAIAQRLHQVGKPPSIDEPEQTFIVRIDRNTVTISADSSGEALHRRPWRTSLGDAPIRPTMAAALLRLVGWTPADALVDPFCGSGTIGIEAALLAAGMPPGGERAFAFHDWLDFDPGSWASVVGGIGASLDGAAVPAPIVLADRDPAMAAATEANAEAAGVADRLSVETRVVAHLRARTDRGWLVTNPPYGRRLQGGDPAALYRRLGAVTRERLPGYGLAVVTSDRTLARAADGRLRSVARFRHGGLGIAAYTRGAAAQAGADAPDAEPAERQGKSAEGPERAD